MDTDVFRIRRPPDREIDYLTDFFRAPWAGEII